MKMGDFARAAGGHRMKVAGVLLVRTEGDWQSWVGSIMRAGIAEGVADWDRGVSTELAECQWSLRLGQLEELKGE